MAPNSNRASFGPKPIVLLDGAFGTTLEDVFHKDIQSTPLWSGALIATDPETVIATHLAFLEAGSRIILTSTTPEHCFLGSYQCSFQTFQKAGYSREAGLALMLKAVNLAGEAKARFLKAHDEVNAEDVKIALSLGPYGATLYPAQEFDAYYPPPYGPRGYAPDGDNCTAFTVHETHLEAEAIAALTEFHLERLLVFLEDHAVWSSVDCIAFETVPLVREIKAIRTAMGRLASERVRAGGTEPSIPLWWISTVWPDGRYPQEAVAGGKRYSPEQVVRAMIADDTPTYPAPDSVGVNCTQLKFIPPLLDAIDPVVGSAHLGYRSGRKLWLTLYPNGGVEYNAVKRVWVNPGLEHGIVGDNWGSELVKVVDKEIAQKIWGGIIVGGCCKTTPEDIRALSKAINAHSVDSSMS